MRASIVTLLLLSPSLSLAEAPPNTKEVHEVAFDVSGKSGATDETNLQVAHKSSYTNDETSFEHYAKIDFQETESAKHREYIIGTSYSNWWGKTGWYFRAEAEHDTEEQLDLRTLGSLGIDNRIIRSEKRNLTAKYGIGYRNENFFDEDRRSLFADIGASYDVDSPKLGKLSASLFYTPNIEHRDGFKARGDIGIDIPATRLENIHIRVGMSSNYDSNPVDGSAKTENKYYIRLKVNY